MRDLPSKLSERINDMSATLGALLEQVQTIGAELRRGRDRSTSSAAAQPGPVESISDVAEVVAWFDKRLAALVGTPFKSLGDEDRVTLTMQGAEVKVWHRLLIDAFVVLRLAADRERCDHSDGRFACAACRAIACSTCLGIVGHQAHADAVDQDGRTCRGCR